MERKRGGLAVISLINILFRKNSKKKEKYKTKNKEKYKTKNKEKYKTKNKEKNKTNNKYDFFSIPILYLFLMLYPFENLKAYYKCMNNDGEYFYTQAPCLNKSISLEWNDEVGNKTNVNDKDQKLYLKELIKIEKMQKRAKLLENKKLAKKLKKDKEKQKQKERLKQKSVLKQKKQVIKRNAKEEKKRKKMLLECEKQLKKVIAIENKLRTGYKVRYGINLKEKLKQQQLLKIKKCQVD